MVLTLGACFGILGAEHAIPGQKEVALQPSASSYKFRSAEKRGVEIRFRFRVTAQSAAMRIATAAARDEAERFKKNVAIVVRANWDRNIDRASWSIGGAEGFRSNSVHLLGHEDSVVNLEEVQDGDDLSNPRNGNDWGWAFLIPSEGSEDELVASIRESFFEIRIRLDLAESLNKEELYSEETDRKIEELIQYLRTYPDAVILKLDDPE
ncbi:MAG: hypothetical protein KDA66_14080 [Planctomycetaceae bacterium]|nr:hypothetical protein [Planctomycetaceae bacterium]